MRFGIREKVALLVFVSTAAAALLVARLMTDRAAEVLREHELVDLGDEAMLRGWVVIDQIEGLREDLINIAFSPTFLEDVAEGKSREELLSMARGLCRRHWRNYLRLDLVRFESEGLTSQVIHDRGSLVEGEPWFPDPDARAGPSLHLSPVQRLRIRREDPNPQGGEPEKRWEPVVWAVAPLDQFGQNTGGAPVYVRLMMTLHGESSPRHFFAMEDMEGSLLVRHDEGASEESGNDEVFQRLREYAPLVEAIEQRRRLLANPIETDHVPKVDRLVRQERIFLNHDYYFQEGTPGTRFAKALAERSPDELDEIFSRIRAELAPLGRIGGMRSGVRELRLLARSREDHAELRRLVVAALEKEFGDDFDRMRWRTLVECDEINVWTVKLAVGDSFDPDEYLIHYAVLDDELASSIEYEMTSVRNVAFLVAGGFGLIGFLIAMHFIRPLREMTETAQAITATHRDGLFQQVSALTQRLESKRRDEIGEISRASRRLFEELLSSQSELERRVEERTQALRLANIELERANEKLMSLSNEKDAFVAKISHDLRQPLNAIFLQVETLKLSQLDDSQRRDVERIHAHAARELNLVNDILEYQKIIMGAESLDRNEIEIGPMLEDLAADHRATLRDKPVDLDVRCDPAAERFVADERRVRQVLGNLLGNACKFTKEGRISLEARQREIRNEHWVEFCITDTGRGMPPEEQSKVFVPFVSNKKDNAGGSGLGLSICRELVTQMGGRIGFVSEHNRGTHFSVFLPLEPNSEHYEPPEPETSDGEGRHPSGIESAQIEGRSESEGSPGGLGRDLTVLVIDDDPKVRQILRRKLCAEGYRVLSASSGEEGLAIAAEQRPDAITLDIVMPGGRDGWEVLHELKSSPVTQSIPVVMISVMAESEDGMALDVEDYLVKPVDVERLFRVIQRATGQAMQNNLLLVDDDRDALEAMGRVLEGAGWSPILAGDGREALEVLERTRPAAIVLDLMMPVMDGFEFLERIEQDAHLRSIPVVVLTGAQLDPEERRFLRERTASVVTKGGQSSEDLVAAVHARIRSRVG